MIEDVEPKYALSKLEGARRLIHATIRMLWQNEDPIAINLLAQSADMLTADLLVNKIGSDMIWDSQVIVKENKKELLGIVRKPSNFVKHADRDPEAMLPVFELYIQAEIATLFSIARFRELSNSMTCHMKFYLGYHHVTHPGHTPLPAFELPRNLSVMRSVTPSQFRAMWGEAAKQNMEYLGEIKGDKLIY
jgi:hypothetical protein